MTSSSLDAGIPILTEVIPLPADVSADASKEQVSEAIPMTLPVPTIDIAPAPMHESGTPQLDDEAWNRMEREIRERILCQVLERIDFVLEQRVRDSLADALQTAVENLAGDIRNGLHNSIRELVTRAVAQEITKLQTTKN